LFGHGEQKRSKLLTTVWRSDNPLRRVPLTDGYDPYSVQLNPTHLQADRDLQADRER